MSRHVVVTGASSGIGEALVREYAAAGARVTLVARRTERLEAIAGEVGGQTHAVTADLGDLEHATAWLPAAEAALGPIDVLINNAGLQVVEPFEDGAADRDERVVRLNLLSPMRITRAVLPAMLARRSGSVVNIASLSALAPTPFMGSYNASKAGLAGWSEALRGELRRTGINVLTVYPGPVKTAMADRSLATYEATGKKVRGLLTGRTDVLAKRVHRAERRRRRRLVYPRSYVTARWFPNLTRFLVDRMTPSLRP